MNIYNKLKSDIIEIVKKLELSGDMPCDLPHENISCEAPKNKEFGDISTNAAMVLAKAAKRPPQVLANSIIEGIKLLPYVEKAEIAGVGFINLTLTRDFWLKQIEIINEQKQNYGNSDVGAGKHINIEFVSANPTGPMHVGHTRSAIYGDVLANIMEKIGYKVTREYYINDAGNQIQTLAKSAYIRYLQAIGNHDIEVGEGLYPGEYLIGAAEELKAKFGDSLSHKPEDEAIEIIKPEIVQLMMKLVKEDLQMLAIKHDIYTSEKSLYERDLITKALEKLAEKGMIYRGVLEAPKGERPDDWEEKEQMLFKSTLYGDDMDRVMQKSNGEWTYFSGDAAYAVDKLNRKYDHLVIVLGADHSGYVNRLKALVHALSDGEVPIDIPLCQMVNFMKDGLPLKMSKRAGNYITAHDVIKEVGKDILRFMMLSRKNDIIMDFDLEKVKEESKDNAVFYVNYAYARANSVLRNAVELGHRSSKESLGLLVHECESEFIKELCAYPKAIESSAFHKEPHRIIYYLHDLAANFHSWWNRGKEDESLRFIMQDNKDLTAARLYLIEAFTYVVESAMRVIGADAVKKM